MLILAKGRSTFFFVAISALIFVWVKRSISVEKLLVIPVQFAIFGCGVFEFERIEQVV